jgi:hypothetical protein
MAELLRMKAMPASVRVAALGGEALTPAVAAQVHEAGIDRLFNLYGPSETTTYSTWAWAQREAPEIFIGRPVAQTQVYVLDAGGEPVPVGVAGELYIAGAGVARGYLRRPALSAERFVPDPFGPPGARMYRTGDLVRWRANGQLVFLGRVDHQVKVRGFRIELGEIETLLDAQPGVRRSVVLAREDTPGDQRLVAYIERETGATVTEAELRAAVQARLPEFMVPGAFVVLDAMPETPNRKVNRKALPAPEHRSTSTYVAPRTATEETLARIWADVLHRDRVGVEDNFFELGGHSLLAMQLVARVGSALQADIALGPFFRTPTIAGLIDMLADAVGGRAVLEQIAQAYIDILGLSEAEVKQKLAEQAPLESI